MSDPPLRPAARDSVDDRGFFGHPKGLAVLFFTELWERFSFYGMRALLVLYMVWELGYDKSAEAYPVYGAYGALVYAFPVLGGYIANLWIGYRNAVVLGAVLMALGHFAMAIEHEVAFYLALSLLCIGNGFFKPNISSTVGRLYPAGDDRRERGFTIFYMAINIGAFLSPIVCGTLGEKIDWHYGFGAAGVGMLAGLFWFLAGQKHVGHHGDPDDPELASRSTFVGLNRVQLTWLGALALAPMTAYALYVPEIATWVIYSVSGVVLAILLGLVFRLEGKARTRMIALLVLMGFHMLFFAGFEQAGSSFNVLTKSHVDREIFGFELEASVFQAVNPMFIFLLIPLFLVMWRKLSAAKKNPSIPAKFGVGLLFLGLGFWAFTFGIDEAGASGTQIAVSWLILTYFLHTFGELWISPIGLSAVTELVPKRWTGFCMGAWFLTIANAHLLAAAVAGLTGGEGAEEAEGAAALAKYSEVYFVFAGVLVGAAVLLFVLTPFIKRLIGDLSEKEEEAEFPDAKVVRED